ncbi:MAG TPA: type II secretion system protein [Pseudomonadales bacterium]
MRKHGVQGGFTLIEMVASIVILAIALVGVANMVSLGTGNSANTLLQTRAMALGESYLDEIMGRRFDERSAASGFDPCYGLDPMDPERCSAVLGPDPGESSRDRYDDVDDYNGFEEGDGATLLEDVEGNEREGYENFHVAVAVRYAGDDEVLGLDETDAKLITVTITTRDQEEGWEFSVYRANY